LYYKKNAHVAHSNHIGDKVMDIYVDRIKTRGIQQKMNASWKLKGGISAYAS
jgi:hypothetical protein